MYPETIEPLSSTDSRQSDWTGLPTSVEHARLSGTRACGVLLVDKPAGLSSAQVVAHVRRHVLPRNTRVGHAGTLDPNATGLLVLLVGRATRLASHAEHGRKTYQISILLGRTTSTDDIWGDTLATSDVSIPEAHVRAALLGYVGQIDQVPPQVSAVQVNGERAYARVRKGQEVLLAPRRVTIYSIEGVSIQDRVIHATVTCSRGTYMRSLARDLGQQLGCGACISAIRRTESWPFSIATAVPMESVQATDIRAWDSLFPGAMRISIDARVAEQLTHGDIRALSTLTCAPISEPSASLAVCIRASDGAPWALLKRALPSAHRSGDVSDAPSNSSHNAGSSPLERDEVFPARWVLAANMAFEE